jgi:hypothetical protein
MLEQPVWTLALGFKLRGRQCSRLYSPFNDVGLIASLRRKCPRDVLDCRLKLLVRQVLDRIAVLDLVLARDQQRQNLQVRGRLCSAHTFNRLRTAVPEVSEQGRNKLAVQLLAVTRADRPAGRDSPPEKPSKKEASKPSKQVKSARKLQRPQTVVLPPKKPPIPDFTEAARPEGTEGQSAPSPPALPWLPSRWPEAPPPGRFSR